MISSKSLSTSHWPGIIIFLVTLAIGLSVYQDYGISWDEPIQRGMGSVSYNYVFQNDSSLIHFDERSHGVAFELPLILIEKKMHITDQRDLYLMRHLVTHLFFLFSCFFGYILCLRLFKDQFLACLGYVMFVFHPRIYAHSFFNTKDIPFLSALIILFAITQIAFDKNKTVWYLLMAIACAYATAIRAMGILFAAGISLFFIIDLINAILKKEKVAKTGSNFALFLAGYLVCLIAMWPILWTKPVFHFIEEFKALSHIYWHGFILLNGINYPGEELPWYYAPEWISISTPVLWVISGFAGLAWLVISFFKKPVSFLSNPVQRNFLLYAICFTIPVFMVIALKSILYDDWRHLYFVYPSFVLLGLFALSQFKNGVGRKIVIALSLLQVAVLAVFMVRNHPFENVYFNELVSHKTEHLRESFDMDYWGCADKQGIEYILAHDPADTVKIWWSLDPVGNNRMMIPTKIKERVKLVDSAQATYFMTNWRNHPADYSFPDIYYDIRVMNSSVLRIYKIK